MPSTVDSLQINITASAASANKAIDSLVSKLDKLSGSLKGNNVGNASKRMSSGFDKISYSARRAEKSFGGLASAIGKFYASYFLAIRGIKGLWSSIQSTADYIEAYNYFNVALGKIGSDWSHQFEQYGYENAEAYADSFATRLSDSMKSLSGVSVEVGADGKGLLTSTGMKNLGLNIREVTQYASQLASVTNAVGQTGEVSLAAANAFTKLGADMSSLFNMDYSQVMKNLQSGLIGQSRALYRFGVDITNATLQTYAYELGLSKAVSEMTQAEKMQLRMIAILDQSKVSWGDLANTINSPSNMIRQFANNLKEVGMIFGQLFIPLLQKALPVINGVTIAFKNLLVNMAGFFGIQLDLSSFGQGYSDIGDDVDGLTDSLDDATASAKKLKTATLGIDELNINSPQDASGGAGGVGGGIDLTSEILDATNEYKKAWDEAFAQMESRAQAFANKFDKIFAPIKNMAFHFSIGDFEAVGNDFSNLVIGITDFFTNAINSVNWDEVGNNIGDFLEGIDWVEILKSVGGLVFAAIESALETWDGAFDAAPIEASIIGIAFSIPILTKVVTDLSKGAGLASAGVKALGGVFGAISTPALVVSAAIASVALGLGVAFAKSEEVQESFSEAIGTIQQGFAPLLDMFASTLIPGVQTGFKDLISSLAPLGNFLNKVFVDTWQKVINPTLKYFGETVLPTLTTTFKNLWDNVLQPFGKFLGSVLAPVTEKIAALFSRLWNDVIMPLSSAVGGTLQHAFESLAEIFNNTVIPIWNLLVDVMSFLWQGVLLPLIEGLQEHFTPIFETSIEVVQGLIEGLSKSFNGLIDFVTGVFTLNWEKAWNGVKDIFAGIFNGLITIVEGVINLMICGINDFTSSFRGLVSEFGGIIGIDIVIPDIPTISIPRFKYGGFPEDGLFMANHNELIGEFSNGRTAVANNEQIVSGIKQGVREAVGEMLAPYLADIARNTRETADKDTSVYIGDKDIARANARGSRALGYALVT